MEGHAGSCERIRKSNPTPTIRAKPISIMASAKAARSSTFTDPIFANPQITALFAKCDLLSQARGGRVDLDQGDAAPFLLNIGHGAEGREETDDCCSADL
jgi:hypothetical protein